MHWVFNQTEEKIIYDAVQNDIYSSISFAVGLYLQ